MIRKNGEDVQLLTVSKTHWAKVRAAAFHKHETMRTIMERAIDKAL